VPLLTVGLLDLAAAWLPASRCRCRPGNVVPLFVHAAGNAILVSEVRKKIVFRMFVHSYLVV